MHEIGVIRAICDTQMSRRDKTLVAEQNLAVIKPRRGVTCSSVELSDAQECDATEAEKNHKSWQNKYELAMRSVPPSVEPARERVSLNWSILNIVS